MYRVSGSLKVIETIMDQSATYDFLLVVLSKYQTILYQFRDKQQFSVENHKFSQPHI